MKLPARRQDVDGLYPRCIQELLYSCNHSSNNDDFVQPLQFIGNNANSANGDEIGDEIGDLTGSEDESDDPLHPPSAKRQTGRPKRRRIRHRTEDEGEPCRVQNDAGTLSPVSPDDDASK